MNALNAVHENKRLGHGIRVLLSVMVFVVGLAVPADRIQARDGVAMPWGSFDAEEAGYFTAFTNAGGPITALIADIQHDWFMEQYWESLGDPSLAARFAERRATNVVALRRVIQAREGFMREALPPEEFKNFHGAVLRLLAVLSDERPFPDVQREATNAFRVLNLAKLSLERRGLVGESPFSPPSSSRGSSGPMVIFRPLNLPVIYNLTTGQWNVSFNIPTPLGSLTVIPFPQQNDAAPKPILFKLMVDDEARYFLCRPGTTVSHSEELIYVNTQFYEQMVVTRLKRRVPLEPRKAVRR